MLILTAILLLTFKLFLAGKDSTSYLLKEQHIENELTLKRIKRWHRDGVILDALFTGVVCWASKDFTAVLGQSVLIRLCIYDLAFNYWSGLDYRYLGSTAAVDKTFIKIFGENGALKKSVFFFILLVIFSLLV